MKELEPGVSAGVFDFKGAGLRSLVIDDVEWFVVADACRILALGNPSMALKRVENDDKFVLRRSDTLTIFEGIDVPPQIQSLAIVTEAGLWQLVLTSTKAEAREFQAWITRDVIPAIRQTGSYNAAPALTGSELLARAVLEADRMIKELTPKAEFHDAVVASPQTWSWLEVAKEFGQGRNLMLAELRTKKILMDNNLPYQSYARHFEVERVQRPTNPEIFDLVTRVRSASLPWLYRRLHPDGGGGGPKAIEA